MTETANVQTFNNAFTNINDLKHVKEEIHKDIANINKDAMDDRKKQAAMLNKDLKEGEKKAHEAVEKAKADDHWRSRRGASSACASCKFGVPMLASWMKTHGRDGACPALLKKSNYLVNNQCTGSCASAVLGLCNRMADAVYAKVKVGAPVCPSEMCAGACSGSMRRRSADPSLAEKSISDFTNSKDDVEDLINNVKALKDGEDTDGQVKDVIGDVKNLVQDAESDAKDAKDIVNDIHGMNGEETFHHLLANATRYAQKLLPKIVAEDGRIGTCHAHDKLGQFSCMFHKAGWDL